MTDVSAGAPEPKFVEQTWDLAYRHAVGATVGAFFDGLKERRLLGRRCNACSRVLFPPRSYCDRCHELTDEWVSLMNAGTLEMFTIVVESFPGAQVSAPYVLAYVRPDGADTAGIGYLKDIDLSDVASAAEILGNTERAEIRFIDAPEGKVTDFWYVIAT